VEQVLSSVEEGANKTSEFLFPSKLHRNRKFAICIINISAINAFMKAGFYRAATIPNLVKDRENRPLDVVVIIKDIRPARDEAYEYDF
jgi:hypothetical protein